MELITKPKITFTVECRDKDGNLKWTEQGTIQPEPEKEQDGEPSND